MHLTFSSHLLIHAPTGYGDIDPKLWPFYLVAGLSPANPLLHGLAQSGCGARLRRGLHACTWPLLLLLLFPTLMLPNFPHACCMNLVLTPLSTPHYLPPPPFTSQARAWRSSAPAPAAAPAPRPCARS